MTTPVESAEIARDAWLAATLGAYGMEFLSAERVRDSPAGAVFAVQTDRGRCYLKTCVETSAHEPALTVALANWFPQDVPTVLGMDPSRGWLLLADAGPTLREQVRSDGDRTRSIEMVRRFAALQRASAAHVKALLALGVPDRRLSRLPDLLESLLDSRAALMIGHEDGLSQDDYTRLRAFGPELRDLCNQLSQYNLPNTIQHEDFHSGNVGVSGTDYSFFDWGESFIGLPFGSLLIALRDGKWVLGYDDALLDAMRGAYLSVWADAAPAEHLDEAVAISFRLAALGRALTWSRVLAHADEAYRAENVDAVPYWLLTFLNNTPMD